MGSPGGKFGNQDCSLHGSLSEGFHYLAVDSFVLFFSSFIYS